MKHNILGLQEDFFANRDDEKKETENVIEKIVNGITSLSVNKPITLSSEIEIPYLGKGIDEVAKVVKKAKIKLEITSNNVILSKVGEIEKEDADVVAENAVDSVLNKLKNSNNNESIILPQSRAFGNVIDYVVKDARNHQKKLELNLTISPSAVQLEKVEPVNEIQAPVEEILVHFKGKHELDKNVVLHQNNQIWIYSEYGQKCEKVFTEGDEHYDDILDSVCTACRRKVKRNDVFLAMIDNMHDPSFGLIFAEDKIVSLDWGKLQYIIYYTEIEDVDISDNDLVIYVEGRNVKLDTAVSGDDERKQAGKARYNLLMDILECLEG